MRRWCQYKKTYQLWLVDPWMGPKLLNRLHCILTLKKLRFRKSCWYFQEAFPLSFFFLDLSFEYLLESVFKIFFTNGLGYLVFFHKFANFLHGCLNLANNQLNIKLLVFYLHNIKYYNERWLYTIICFLNADPELMNGTLQNYNWATAGCEVQQRPCPI